MKKVLLTGAGVLTLDFLVLHLAGLRECTSVLSGTYPMAGAMGACSALLGLVYAAVYMVFVIAAPILALSAGVTWLLDRFSRPTREEAQS